MADELLIERHGAVAVLHIDRPTRRNALGDALVAHMRGTFAQLDADAAVGWAPSC